MNIVKIEVLDKEITRKQFLQVMAGGGLALFGLNNFLSVINTLTARKPTITQGSDPAEGFGTRRFGV